jgi:hypothetical protein
LALFSEPQWADWQAQKYSVGREGSGLAQVGRSARVLNGPDTAQHPRGVFRPSFVSVLLPLGREGAGKTGCRLGTHGPLCANARRTDAQRHTGAAKQPAFPAQWLYGLCRALPGERCTIAPVALRIADARTRSGRHITARLDAQTPGVRTTRFRRTHAAPVVCARQSLTV